MSDHVGGRPAAGVAYRLAAGTILAAMRLQSWRIRVRGLGSIPRHGGAVLVANHTSFWDFFTTAAGPYLAWRRPVRILAKASLFQAPVIGPIMRGAGHIPVQRARGARALSDAVAALRRGELLLVLPEQTISPSFELLPFKRGAARMAAEAGVPLVPALSWGTHRFHTVGRRPRWSWRLPVEVVYGRPLTPRPIDDPAVVMEQLRERMRALLDQVQRSYPHGAPAGAWWVPARLGGAAPTLEAAEEHVSRVQTAWQQAADQLRQAGEQLRHEAQHARDRLHEGVEHARERIAGGGDDPPER